jgi:hypothetical protein
MREREREREEDKECFEGERKRYFFSQTSVEVKSQPPPKPVLIETMNFTQNRTGSRPSTPEVINFLAVEEQPLLETTQASVLAGLVPMLHRAYLPLTRVDLDFWGRIHNTLFSS